MEDQEYTIDLMELFSIVMENLKTIAKIAAAFVALAILYLLIASPVYESTALLRIKQQQGLGSSLLDAATGGSAQLNQRQMHPARLVIHLSSVMYSLIWRKMPWVR